MHVGVAVKSHIQLSAGSDITYRYLHCRGYMNINRQYVKLTPHVEIGRSLALGIKTMATNAFPNRVSIFSNAYSLCCDTI